MSVLGGSQGTQGAYGVRSSTGEVKRHVRTLELPGYLREMSAYAIAALILAAIIAIDDFRLDRVRENIAAAEAEELALTTEHERIVAEVIDDIEGGRAILFLGGVIRSGDMCLLDPVVEEEWLLMVGRAGDGSSAAAFVVGVFEGADASGLQTAIVDWDEGRNAYIVAAPDSAYYLQAVGGGLPASETTQC